MASVVAGASDDTLSVPMQQAKTSGGFDNMFLARPDGSQINVNGAILPPDNNDPRKWKWYQQALVTPNEVYFSTLSVAAATLSYVLSLGKVLNRDGATLGVLGADVSINEILEQLKQIKLPGNGSALFVDHDGIILGHNDKNAWTSRWTAYIRHSSAANCSRWRPAVARSSCSMTQANVCT